MYRKINTNVSAVAAGRSTVFAVHGVNRDFRVIDTDSTTIFKVFIQMLHFHSACLTPLFFNLCQLPPCKLLFPAVLWVLCRRLGPGAQHSAEPQVSTKLKPYCAAFFVLH